VIFLTEKKRKSSADEGEVRKMTLEDRVIRLEKEIADLKLQLGDRATGISYTRVIIDEIIQKAISENREIGSEIGQILKSLLPELTANDDIDAFNAAMSGIQKGVLKSIEDRAATTTIRVLNSFE
jgi:hypothetical protein